MINCVKIQLAEEELELAGLIDSGNQLYDPLTKTPVMIMHISSLEHCLPAWLTEQIYSKHRFLKYQKMILGGRQNYA